MIVLVLYEIHLRYDTHVMFTEPEEVADNFIDLNKIRVEGSIREVEPPEGFKKPTTQGRTKLVSFTEVRSRPFKRL